MVRPVSAPIPSAPAAQVASVSGALTHQEAVEIFVGKNYDYFERKWLQASQHKHKHAWSWAAFLAGFGWMAYRKMYWYYGAFVVFVLVQILAEAFLGLPPAVSNGANIGVGIAFGMKGNVWYQAFVDKKVSQILAIHTPDQARLELARQGGTNIGIAIGLVVAALVLLGCIVLLLEG